MASSTTSIEIVASERFDFLDLTDELHSAIKDSGVESGAAFAFTAHTTCALLINEWEDGALSDLVGNLTSLVPHEGTYYAHDDFTVRRPIADDERRNGHAHVKAMLLSATSQFVPVVDGAPLLGLWQRLLFLELDEPKPRTVAFHVFGDC